MTRITRLSVPIPIQRVVEEDEKEEEDIKKAGKEEVAVASEDINFVGTQLDLVCLGDEIVYGSSVPHSGDGNGSTGENNNKLGLASGEVQDVFIIVQKVLQMYFAKFNIDQLPWI